MVKMSCSQVTDALSRVEVVFNWTVIQDIVVKMHSIVTNAALESKMWAIWSRSLAKTVKNSFHQAIG